MLVSSIYRDLAQSGLLDHYGRINTNCAREMADQRKAAASGGQQRTQKSSRPVKSFRHLELVWAKVSGFFHWPGQAVDPTQSYLVPRKLRKPPRPGMFLVKFFGSYD